MKEKITILVIDDNPGSLEASIRRLDASGYLLMPVSSCQEALSILSGEQIDCVLLSSRLTQMPAVEAVKRIKSVASLKYTPVVMLAGPKESDALFCLEAGADDYIIDSNSAQMALMKLKMVLRRKHLRDEVSRLNKMVPVLQSLSMEDSVTGLHNKRYFLECLNMEVFRVKRCEYNICCVMIDIDYFKQVNDGHGHAFGDFVLKKLGECLKANFRGSDVLARYGGDEFIVLMINTDYSVIFNIAERFRKYVEGIDFSDKGTTVKLTVSIGLSSFLEDGVFTKEDFLSFADKACYEAKARGRNNSVTCKELSGQAKPSDRENLLAVEKRVYSIVEYPKRSYIEAISDLISAWEENNSFLSGHSANVLKYVRLITREMNLPKNEIEIIENAAAVHDLGKLLIGESILLKNGGLTSGEQEIMRRHPALTVNLLSKNKFMKMELPIILYHHERYDGTGYPLGLEGKHIPLGSRIIKVADVYDDACSGRLGPDKPLAPGEVAKKLLDESGKAIDPEIADIFLKALKKQAGK
ncbi:MAG: diguanylate cyclase [Candidatus Omnitrophota bacterium]